MKRVCGAIAALLAMLAASSALAAIAVAAPVPSDSAQNRLDVYTGELPPDALDALVELGIDRHQLDLSRPRRGRGADARVRVETILSAQQVRILRREGIRLTLKRIDGATVAQDATEAAAQGLSVFRPYSGAGGLKEEFEQVAAAHPEITKLVSYGTTVNGQDILALKVSADASTARDGSKPSVLYMGAQHAREWITPEMVRRLMRRVVEGEATDATLARLLADNELWFIPVANPDGYDWTFQPGQRLWRKNLRDNDGDGRISPGDGVDLNRNFPTRWGYDNEGSSPDPAGETYRGPSPASEPETRALDALVERVGFEFMVNYHSAAELLLYGTGWQVATPSPDEVIYEALAGDDAKPAVPGYDPDSSAELYTTNGDTDTHMTEAHGTLGFTPEMATCESASDADPDDAWQASDCGSGFQFPDDEALVQAEFERNVAFALSVARSAADPDDPVSVVGRTAEAFRVDSFTVSHGDPQTVAVVAKRSLGDLRLHYRVDGGEPQTAPVSEWDGGERYGNENDVFYAEFRGQVRGAPAGASVEVWFTGQAPREGEVSSRPFSYTVAPDSGARVLVIANEDYTGVNPTYPAGTSAPKYAQAHVAAIEAAGYDADVWDVDAQGVPHDLGVLSHYDAVVWYLGDNRFTQDPEDEFISSPLGDLRDTSVSEDQQYLTIAVRDFLNEGGKLIHAGETAQHSGLPGIGDAVGGLYYGRNGDPAAECVITSLSGLFEDCLILADDFRQYYLGAFARTELANPTGVLGIADPIEGFEAALGGPVVGGANPLDEAGVFQPTSDVLPPEQFPQFRSAGAAQYPVTGTSPYSPVEGERYAGALHGDSSYLRLSRTVDLRSATSAQLRFQLSLDTEPAYDHLIVEAHTVGQDDWTTLPDINGGTSPDPPAECTGESFLLALHPFLGHYIGGADCTAAGSTGRWHSFTGTTDGWKQVAFDLTPYAGREVELAITYVTDPATGGTGVFVDDTRIVIDGADGLADGFEGADSGWSAAEPPDGSPSGQAEWRIGEGLVQFYAGTSTPDTLLLGFGLEQLAQDADRVELVDAALDDLLTGD